RKRPRRSAPNWAASACPAPWCRSDRRPSVTIFDYLVLFVLISSVVISTLRGLVKEILSLLGWIVAFVVANAYGAGLAPLLPEVIPGDTARLIVAFIALFLGVRILMGLLSLAIGALVEATGLSLAD